MPQLISAYFWFQYNLLLKLSTTLNFQTAISYEGIFLRKNRWHILWSAHQNIWTAFEKKNLSVLVQKLTFLPQAKFKTSSIRKEQRNFFNNERTFEVYAISVSAYFWFQCVPYYWSCQPLKLSIWCISWRNFPTKKGWQIHWSAHQELSIAVEKKTNLSVSIQKLTFLP